MSSIIDNYMSEFQCPVCQDLVTPPIHQCQIGHIICNACFVKIDKCPICRGAKDKNRAHLLENLYKNFIFPCKYRDEGCTFTGKGELITEHQFDCVFYSRSCPLSEAMKCFWSGSVDKVFKHCQLKHAPLARKGNKHSFTVKSFDHIAEKTEFFHIIEAHGEVFQFCSCKFPDGHVRWRLVLIGFQDELERYNCKVYLGKSLEYILLCSSIHTSSDDIFDDKFCAVSSAENVKAVCEENNGDFIYNIRIVDRGFELFLNEVMGLK